MPISNSEQAKIKLDCAWSNFNNAEKDSIDVAIAELNLAESEYNAFFQPRRPVEQAS